MTVIAVLQARMGSSRLPGKSLADICGKPMLWHVIAQLKRSKTVGRIVIATTINADDDRIEKLAKDEHVDYFRGSEQDVLDRYMGAVRKFGGRVVVRVTADCPLLDPEVVDQVVSKFLSTGCAYASNVHPPTFPDGLDVEVFTSESLERAWKEAKLASEREHVTPYIWKHPEIFSQENVLNKSDFSYMRWTVDTPEDLEVVRAIYEKLGSKASEHAFNMDDIIKIIGRYPEIVKANSKFKRNEGYAKSLKEDRKL